jgi:glycosyltransferase involved in cell wall biosynthesis
MRRALILSTRLAGTDGVSLEASKLCTALARLGFESVACAGELDHATHRQTDAAADRGASQAAPPEGAFAAGWEIPAMHFRDPAAVALGERAFGGEDPDPGLEREIEGEARALAESLQEVVRRVRPELLVVQNAWAIPMQLPLAGALARLARATGLPVLSHEHDYWWERERFCRTRIPAFVARHFPYHGPRVAHLCINGAARRELRRRRGLEARVLPNVMDFATPAPGVDAFNADFREAAGVGAGERLFLQPTRVVPRKGIELAIDLLAALDDARNILVISHPAGDEGLDTLRRLEERARGARVALRYVADRVGDRRGRDASGRKRYALTDAYPQADFVTYPSLYEGFGNALLETVYFRRPALVNRYPVYREDIAPKGFRFVEIEGRVDQRAVTEVARLLDAPHEVEAMTAHNFALAARHYGLDTVERVCREALADVREGAA